MEKLKDDFQRVYNKGVGSLSVVLMHSYTLVVTNFI